MKPTRRIESVLLPLALAIVFIAVWHYSVIATHTRVFPAPLAVVKGLQVLAGRGVLLRYIGDSLFRVGSGFFLAAIVAIPLGSVMGRFRFAAIALNPVVQILRPIS